MWHDVIVKLFWSCFVSLVKFSYNIITGSGVVTISFYYGLTRNQEIGNTLVWILPDIGDWEEFENQIWHVYNKMLLNAAKYQGYSFYRFWVLKGEPKGGGGTKLPPFPTQIRVKNQLFIALITICSYFAPNLMSRQKSQCY